jgi:hypothetical protein
VHAPSCERPQSVATYRDVSMAWVDTPATRMTVDSAQGIADQVVADNLKAIAGPAPAGDHYNAPPVRDPLTDPRPGDRFRIGGKAWVVDAVSPSRHTVRLVDPLNPAESTFYATKNLPFVAEFMGEIEYTMKAQAAPEEVETVYVGVDLDQVSLFTERPKRCGAWLFDTRSLCRYHEDNRHRCVVPRHTLPQTIHRCECGHAWPDADHPEGK